MFSEQEIRSNPRNGSLTQALCVPLRLLNLLVIESKGGARLAPLGTYIAQLTSPKLLTTSNEPVKINSF